MSDEIDYGKNNKRIIFTDTDHRHAQLTLKLKNDGMTQAKFFRSIISGYLNDDERIRDYVVENGNLSIKKKQQNIKARQRGKDSLSEMGLSNEQVEDIFDLISEEFPEL
jgi:hypothetical protein